MENNSTIGQARQAVGTSSEMLVGVFDKYANAQQALDTMLLAGFPSEIVRLYPEPESAAKSQHADRIAVDVDSMLGSSLGQGRDQKHKDIYIDAVRRGHYLLVVNAHTDEQIDQAAAIMNRFKVVDIDERAAHWEHQGWTGYHENAEKNRSGMQISQPASQLTADEADYRNHWQSVYGDSGRQYEDYDAAYHYGSAVARCGHYKNAQWDDIQAQLRTGWESNHPGTWEKFKDAVEHGALRTYTSRS